MKTTLFDQIKDFIETQRWKYDFPLTRNTLLQKDLKIWGDDAVDFLEAFGKKFDVDLSTFKIDLYFRTEGGFSMFNSFFKEKNKYKALTIGDLEDAVNKGVLE